MFELDFTLGPLHLRITLANGDEPQPQGDVYANVERKPEDLTDVDGRISLRA